VRWSTGKARQGFKPLSVGESARAAKVLGISLGTGPTMPAGQKAPPTSPVDDRAAYEKILGEIGDIAQLEERREVVVRKEQAFLRKYLFGSNEKWRCALCEREFPVGLLVAAHIKRRADCTDQEKRQYRANVIPMCKFGCDDLFERGYLVVTHGKVIPGTRQAETDTVKNYVTWLRGRDCRYWNPDREPYFDWHRNNVGTR
jgi:hypothetical protein